MAHAYSIESAIHELLAQAGTCSLDELADRLPAYTWNQVFDTVDRLTREGTISFQHPAPFLYLLSLPATQPVEAGHVMPS